MFAPYSRGLFYAKLQSCVRTSERSFKVYWNKASKPRGARENLCEYQTMSGLSVQWLWGIYIVAVVVIALLLCFLFTKSSTIGCSIGVFIATILAALIIYLVTIYNIDPSQLSPGEQSSLGALNITMLVLIVLAFFFCIIELAMKGGKHGPHKVVEAECSKSTGECEVKSVKLREPTKDGGVSVTTMGCTDGECSPTELFLRDKNGNDLKIHYLS